jgi:hypothetical protein
MYGMNDTEFIRCHVLRNVHGGVIGNYEFII